MSTLTENIVLSRTRSQDLRNVRKLNCWGSELKDVSIVKKLVNVEVLSLSLNNIDTLYPFAACKYLQELYLRKNCISNLNELCYLRDLQYLRKLWLAENPCAERANYRMTVIKALPALEMLDNIPVTAEEVSKAQTAGDDLQDPTESDKQQESGVKLAATTQHDEDEYESNEETEECNNRANDPQEKEVSDAKILERSYSVPSPPHQPTNKNQRFSYPDVGQQWSAPKECSTPRPATVVPPQMLRSASISDYAIFNGSNSSNIPYQYASSHQTKLVNTNETMYDVNAPYYAYENSANGLHSKANSENSHKSNYLTCHQQKMLSKGGKNRVSNSNANILSAVLCLIKELDYASLEVVETAIHCRMEEMDT
ncbi:uncharacterized protein B4U79_15105 [Dinothrombium tinctorium]|uniref:U2A'/phosphoprotein 32 family A C-terminal domain-containing protein n=1 Tax=Dinothrombium tinctorium TaxID=1965070 RepID=A0A3S3P447_9ACAR|nr:uncharacterized protein B4U79_15105 [Dinothrombium tinctorium]